MSRRVVVRHRIGIECGAGGEHELPTHWGRLRPIASSGQRIVSYSLQVQPRPTFVNWVRDPLQNHVARIDFPEPLAGAEIVAETIVELEASNPFSFLLEASAATYPFDYPPRLRDELVAFLRVPPGGTAFTKWLGRLDRDSMPVTERLSRSVAEMADTVDIDPGRVGYATDSEGVVGTGRASADELAWLFALALRSLGFATRLVHGYVIASSSDAASVAARGWVQVYLPGAGWVGLDPVARVFTDESYLTVAVAPDPGRARFLEAERSPLDIRHPAEVSAAVLAPGGLESRGAAGIGDRVDLPALQPVRQPVDPSVAAPTAPGADNGPSLALQRTLAVTQLDAEDEPEWSYAALGAAKPEIAGELIDRLGRRLSVDDLRIVSQSEWYSGEGAPRWRLLSLSRADGETLWRSPTALVSRDAGSLDLAALEGLAHAVARNLGVEPQRVRAAYEDALFIAWKNGGVAESVAPEGALSDPTERARLAERLSAGSDPVGFVLPLHRDRATSGWRSGSWPLRRDGLYLTPGDAPMGVRLPLDELPPVPTPAEDDDPVDLIPRLALCFERREGRLHLYLPPTETFEGYTRLLKALDDALCAAGVVPCVEGYGPPDDPRIRCLAIEPDVGVLRVALPVCAGLADHERAIDAGYQECAALGLAPYRQTKGGDRVPLGQPSTLSIREQDPSSGARWRQALAGLIRLWQSHPSLSYLFATRQIGPDGVAARAQETRIGAAYEIEIGLASFAAAEAGAASVSALQHLFTDVKFDPRGAELAVGVIGDAARGRSAKLVIRAFDMPPDASLATLQSRLLVAMLNSAASAFPDPLHAFGRAQDRDLFSDRFYLPRVLWHDFADLLGRLPTSGGRLELSWFRPLLEFHFPLLGAIQVGDFAVELRRAHEPQPVLAEQATGAGVARFVDGANERLEIRAMGLTPGRHVIACNGRVVPLASTGTSSEFVCGVRYKARGPAATLHPTIPPVQALVFDLIDLWTRRRLGGCTYRPAAGVSYLRFVEEAPQPSYPGGPVAVPLVARAPVVDERIVETGRFVPQGTAPSAPLELANVGGRPYCLDLTVG